MFKSKRIIYKSYQTNVVVNGNAGVPVVLVDNCSDYWDGLVHVFLFVNIHSSQHNLEFLISSTGGAEKK